jgi:hypothetical protein
VRGVSPSSAASRVLVFSSSGRSKVVTHSCLIVSERPKRRR